MGRGISYDQSRANVSSSEIYDLFVTLTLLLEDVKAGTQILPSQFLKANGVNKFWKNITILAENKAELSGYLLSGGGTIALENGGRGEANDIKAR
ncbi:unnamed protein product [Eruca vesicaria subsp. sativa]|uniref:Uncharacterized protein n=1 Tax=Eruca vesicaria subsp. sativa TaxID=29727 RepID=A0ABC8J360_ERUVS|nr:unnamed protein product [Eruca vesicaria subsp. sativa]